MNVLVKIYVNHIYEEVLTEEEYQGQDRGRGRRNL